MAVRSPVPTCINGGAGQGAHARTDQAGVGRQRLAGFRGNRSHPACLRQGDLAQVVMGPHNPLWHTGGAACVDEELIVSGPLNIQGPAVAVFDQIIKAFSAKAATSPAGPTSTQVFTLGRRGRISAIAARNSEA